MYRSKTTALLTGGRTIHRNTLDGILPLPSHTSQPDPSSRFTILCVVKQQHWAFGDRELK